MNFNWKHTTGVLALSVAMLSVSAGAQVAPAGKPVKPPAEVVQPAPSVDVETGQLLIKIKIPPSAQKTSNTPPPVDDTAAPPSAEKIETGQLLIKDKPTPPSAAKKKGPKVGDDPVSTRSSLLPALGGLAALAAVITVASGNNDDRPTSP